MLDVHTGAHVRHTTELANMARRTNLLLGDRHISTEEPARAVDRRFRGIVPFQTFEDAVKFLEEKQNQLDLIDYLRRCHPRYEGGRWIRWLAEAVLSTDLICSSVFPTSK